MSDSVSEPGKFQILIIDRDGTARPILAAMPGVMGHLHLVVVEILLKAESWDESTGHQMYICNGGHSD